MGLALARSADQARTRKGEAATAGGVVMSAWVPSGPAIAELAVMAGIMYLAGSWVSGRQLDRTFAEGWERGAGKIRRGQLDKLRHGLVLVLDSIGRPEWVPVYDISPGAFMEVMPDVLRAVDQPERTAPLVRATSISGGSGSSARLDHRLPESDDRQEDEAAGELAEELGEPDVVPNLGAFVADEPTHVAERVAEPLRSTGGFIPELAGDQAPEADTQCPRCGCEPEDNCDGCYCHESYEAPAPASPGAGQDVPRPGPVHALTGEQVQVAPGHSADPIFGALDDDSAFALIRFEFRRLNKDLHKGFALPGWAA